MNKLIIFTIVLAFAATAYAACDINALATCATDAASCIASALTDKNAICACNGKYAACFLKNGCTSGADWDAFVKSCTSAGCTSAQCSSASTISTVFGLAVAVVAALF